VAIVERTGAALIIVTDMSQEIMISVNERVAESTRDIPVAIAVAHAHLFYKETGNPCCMRFETTLI
jgi:hypothetical protein